MPCCCFLATGCRLLAAGCSLLAAGCWRLALLRIAAPCFHVFGMCCLWLLAGDYWLMITGCWLLAAGCWLLAAGGWRLLPCGWVWLLAAGFWLLGVRRCGRWQMAAGRCLLAAGSWLLAGGCWAFFVKKCTFGCLLGAGLACWVILGDSRLIICRSRGVFSGCWLLLVGFWRLAVFW